MVSVYDIKPKFQKLLQPLLQGLYKMGWTANGITVFALLLSAATGIVSWYYLPSFWVYILIPLVLLKRMALNALDGMMARQYHMQSKLGEILNEAGDVLSDIFIYLPLVKLPGVNAWMAVAFCGMAMFNEFAGVVAKIVSGTRRYDGPMGKSDRALLAGLLCLTYLIWPGVKEMVNYIFALSLLLLLTSTFLRFYRSL